MPHEDRWRQENILFVAENVSDNDPFGSRPEPGAYLFASILLLQPGEAPEGRAGAGTGRYAGCWPTNLHVTHCWRCSGFEGLPLSLHTLHQRREPGVSPDIL
jgi:hypothetical protein